MQTVVETPSFLSDSGRLGLSEAERLAIVSWISSNPRAGDVIEGTGGARKVRFARKGKGKRGGYRVVTFYSGPDIPVFLLNIFAKNEKSDLTAKERSILKVILARITDTYTRRGHAK